MLMSKVLKKGVTIINKSSRKEFISMFKYMKPRLATYFIGLIGHSAVEASIVIVLPIVMKILINAAIKGDKALIKKGLIMIGSEVLLVSVLFVIFGFMFYGTVQKNISNIRLKMFDKIPKLPIAYFEKTHSGDIISRMASDLFQMESAYGDTLRGIVYALISGIGSAVTMFVLDWRIGLVLILIGVLSYVINARFAKEINILSKKIQESMGHLTESMVDILGGFSIIKISSMENIVSKHIDEKNDAVYSNSMKRVKKSSLLDSCNVLISWINFAGIFAVGAFLVSIGQVEFGTLVALINLLGNVSSMIKQLGSLFGKLQNSLAGASRVMEFLNEPIEAERNNVLPAGKQEEEMINIENGEFSYGNNVKVLNNINMLVRKGQFAALVGSSGGGKSTIIKLILGFYNMNKGNISIDGRAMGSYKLKDLRNMIAYIPQDPYMFDGTVEENIRYGGENASMEEIIAASKAANCDEFIKEMPEGYNTVVGERGARLSGGQKQRIAIARAILTARPIIILDEATSALDSQSERKVQAALNKLMQQRTILAIAHRMSTVQNADVIYVIDKGTIVEQGKHNELIKQNGIYRGLYELQFKES
ncbi:MAG: ABC transporter ATP-binding protein [Bacillota bacterium]|nr:ABC transporter ATP-binding protein [Bacillota bacterium]